MTSPKTLAREWRWTISFAAGVFATLLFHQPMFWLLGRFGFSDRPVYAMEPVPPFGVPSVLSLAFWGGVWGIVMIAALSKIRSETKYWIMAVAFGAILPTLVAGAVVAPLKGQKLDGGAKLLLVGLLVNGAWGLGTALLFRLFARQK